MPYLIGVAATSAARGPRSPVSKPTRVCRNPTTPTDWTQSRRNAQVNELLTTVLAYNLTVLIHEIFEHGVTPDFLRSPITTLPPASQSN